jgi:hypothetical protein
MLQAFLWAFQGGRRRGKQWSASGRCCTEYSLDPVRSLEAQYVGLSHVHLRQQLVPRSWYARSHSHCDYTELEDNAFKLVTLSDPELCPDLSDLDVEFRISSTRQIVQLHAV